MYSYLYEVLTNDGSSSSGVLPEEFDSSAEAIAFLNKKEPEAIQITVKKVKNEKLAELQSFREGIRESF
jgi:hypothetical protein